MLLRRRRSAPGRAPGPWRPRPRGPWAARGGEVLQQVLGRVGDLGDRLVERRLVGLAGPGGPRDLAHVLEGGGADLVAGRRRARSCGAGGCCGTWPQATTRPMSRVMGRRRRNARNFPSTAGGPRNRRSATSTATDRLGCPQVVPVLCTTIRRVPHLVAQPCARGRFEPPDGPPYGEPITGAGRLADLCRGRLVYSNHTDVIGGRRVTVASDQVNRGAVECRLRS